MKTNAPNRIARLVTVLTAAGLACVSLASSVSAQQRALPPDEGKPIIQWVCVLLFAGFIIAIAFKNPKRTHLG